MESIKSHQHINFHQKQFQLDSVNETIERNEIRNTLIYQKEHLQLLSVAIEINNDVYKCLRLVKRASEICHDETAIF